MMYNYSYYKIPQIAASKQPFAIIFETEDTHFPKGYMCPLCRKDSNRQFNIVRKCADRQISNFLNWLKKQPYYNNTTIFFVGDHTTMGSDLQHSYEAINVKRTVYNCIINSRVKCPKNRRDFRTFSAVDWFPTILASIGANILGNRLGLGTNLFSNLKTINEQNTNVHTLLEKSMDYYKERIWGRDDFPSFRLLCVWKKNETVFD